MAAQGSEGLAGGEAQVKAAIYSVELSVFEGPLDLLLHLVRRHELDILDIPISFVAEKYLEYLHLMRSLDLEVAGDYLVMAATLAWLKSRELLPAAPREGEAAGADDEEGEDPRAALIRRLVEYERFKNAAAELDAMPVSGRDVFARGADIDVPPSDPGLAPVTLFRLAEAYYRVLTRAKIHKTHDVTIEAVTVAQRMQQLTLMLDERQEFDFEGLFLGRTWSSEPELRQMLVVTLMSVLELVKLGVARVQQVPDTDAIRVYRLVDSEEARKLIETYDEEQSFGAPVEPGAPPPTEAELDALEERTLLAEALAGLSGPEDDSGAGELGMLAEELDPDALLAPATTLTDEADLGPEAIAAEAANSDPTGAREANDDMSEETGDAGQPPEAARTHDELPEEQDRDEPAHTDDPSEKADTDDAARTDDELSAAPEADDPARTDELSEASEADDPARTDDELSEAPEADDPARTDDELSEGPGADQPASTDDELSEEADADEPARTADDLAETPDSDAPASSADRSPETAGLADEPRPTRDELSEAASAEEAARTDLSEGPDADDPARTDLSEGPGTAEPARIADGLSEASNADETTSTADRSPEASNADETTSTADELSETPGPADDPGATVDGLPGTPGAAADANDDLSEAPDPDEASGPARVTVMNDDGEETP